MSLVIYPDISRRTLYSITWKDELYNKLYKSLYDKSILKTLTDKGKAQDEDGSNSDCTYLQLFYLEQYINYLILLKDEATKTTLTEDELTSLRDDTYKLKVVRNNFLCRFGNTNNIDVIKAIVNLGTIAGINNISQLGLDYMILDPNTIYGAELLTNGDFELPPITGNYINNWFNNTGNETVPYTSIVAGQLNFISIGDIQTGAILTVGLTYKLTIDIVGMNSGAVDILDNSFNTLVQYTTIGSKTLTFVAQDTTVIFIADTGVGTIIDNVSIKNLTYISNNSSNDFIII